MSKALVILCGGDSSRMGTDKALLPFKDKCLIEYIIDKYAPFFDKIYLSVNQRGQYLDLNLDVQEIPDIYLNAGPMGAILSSLTMISEDRAFFMSVDNPFLDPATGIYLLDHSQDYHITSFNFSGDYLDTICAVYSKSCIVALGKCILQKNITKSQFYSKCYTNLIELDKLSEASSIPFDQQFYPMKDRNAYYMAIMAILKGNFL